MAPRDLTAFAAALSELEQALRDVGLWEAAEPTADDIRGAGAFGSPTMTFGQWLRWVLLPHARNALESGDLPAHSEVAAYAVRELDGAPYADRLVSALAAFDAAVEAG